MPEQAPEPDFIEVPFTLRQRLQYLGGLATSAVGVCMLARGYESTGLLTATGGALLFSSVTIEQTLRGLEAARQSSASPR